MQIHTPEHAAAKLLVADAYHDERGSFAQTWQRPLLDAHGLDTNITFCARSVNVQKGTLRGLHFQYAPYSQAKYVTCLQGRIYDVIVDIRPNSQHFLHWFAFELDASEANTLYIPQGYAHGFQSLSDQCEVYYQICGAYQPTAESGLLWSCPNLAIDWPETVTQVSKKDRQWPTTEAWYTSLLADERL